MATAITIQNRFVRPIFTLHVTLRTNM